MLSTENGGGAAGSVVEMRPLSRRDPEPRHIPGGGDDKQDSPRAGGGANTNQDMVNMRTWYDKQPNEKAVEQVKANKKLGFCSACRSLPLFAYHAVKLGGIEGVALRVRKIQLDTDGDNIVTEQEAEALDEKAQQLVESVSQLYLNAGVVNALMLSVMGPLLLQVIAVHQKTEDFFGKTGTAVIFHSYYIVLGLVVALNIYTLFLATRSYHALTNWMPNREDQIWYIDTHGQLQIAVLMSNIFWLTGCCFPLGAMLAIGPAIGIYMVVLTAVGSFMACLGDINSMLTCTVYLHSSRKFQKQRLASPRPN